MSSLLICALGTTQAAALSLKACCRLVQLPASPSSIGDSHQETALAVWVMVGWLSLASASATADVLVTPSQCPPGFVFACAAAVRCSLWLAGAVYLLAGLLGLDHHRGGANDVGDTPVQDHAAAHQVRPSSSRGGQGGAADPVAQAQLQVASHTYHDGA